MPRESAKAPTVLTFGNFDGVHLGHRSLLERTMNLARAESARAVALTFDPHPVSVFNPDGFRLVQSLSERLKMLAERGLDEIFTLSFDASLASLTPEEFVARHLAAPFALKAVVVGHDTTFGRGRSGSPELLSELGARYGFAVEVVAPVLLDARVIGSSRIRAAVAAARLDEAAACLGRPFIFGGTVGAGKRRGRHLGFPTANIVPGRGLLLPPPGIYAAWARLDGQRYRGALSIGKNPTFGGDDLSIETFLLDYDGDCYGRELRLEPVLRLRDERRYESPELLAAQIARDVAEVRRVLL